MLFKFLAGAALEYTGAKPDEFINHSTIDNQLSAVHVPRQPQTGFYTEDEYDLPLPNAPAPPDSESGYKHVLVPISTVYNSMNITFLLLELEY